MDFLPEGIWFANILQILCLSVVSPLFMRIAHIHSISLLICCHRKSFYISEVTHKQEPRVGRVPRWRETAVIWIQSSVWDALKGRLISHSRLFIFAKERQICSSPALLFTSRVWENSVFFLVFLSLVIITALSEVERAALCLYFSGSVRKLI